MPYEHLISHEDALNKLLDLGRQKVDGVRMTIPNAAGLVVATSIEHAHQVAAELNSKGESGQVVTTKTPGAQRVINALKKGTCRWIVAVSLISEGTDNPWAAGLLLPKPHSYGAAFSPGTGRVLWRLGEVDQHAWLYILAEPTLKRISQRIADDLPDNLAVVSSITACAFKDGSATPETDAVMQDNLVETCSAKAMTTTQKLLLIGDAGPAASYQVCFSKHYRQQRLAVF